MGAGGWVGCGCNVAVGAGVSVGGRGVGVGGWDVGADVGGGGEGVSLAGGGREDVTVTGVLELGRQASSPRHSNKKMEKERLFFLMAIMHIIITVFRV